MKFVVVYGGAKAFNVNRNDENCRSWLHMLVLIHVVAYFL